MIGAAVAAVVAGSRPPLLIAATVVDDDIMRAPYFEAVAITSIFLLTYCDYLMDFCQKYILKLLFCTV